MFTRSIALSASVLALLLLVGPTYSAATMLVDSSIKKCPADMTNCTPGTVCFWHDEPSESGITETSFLYQCGANKVLCPTMCVTYSADEHSFVAMQVDEQIVFNLDSVLRCERDADGGLSQMLEDISTELIAQSDVLPACR